MADKRWTGNAELTAQVDTVTVTDADVGSTFTITCNSKELVYTADTGVEADVATAIAAMLNSNKITGEVPELAETTAEADGATVVITSDTPGKPFTFTYAPGGSGTPGFTGSTTTANSGPNVLNLADNWSGAALPANGDNLFFDDTDADVLYGLDQFTDTYGTVNFTPSFTGLVGLNQDAGEYYEYRPRYLVLKAATVTINSPTSRIRLDSSTVQVTVNVLNLGDSENPNLPAMLWKGTHASNVVNSSKSSIGLAYLVGEVATIATMNVGYITDQSRDSVITGGPGLTLGVLNMNGGEVTLNAAVTTVSGYNGTLTLIEGNVTTLNNFGATVVYRANDTITTYDGREGATINFNSDPRGRTVTNCTLRKGTFWKDEAKTVTFSNAVSFPDGDPPQLGEGSSFGPNRTYAIT